VSISWQEQLALGDAASRAFKPEYQARCFIDPVRMAIQNIAARIYSGSLVPCPTCQRGGVPLGVERYTDAAGSMDERNCSTCDGWTVVPK
jgi:hypothetical protein